MASPWPGSHPCSLLALRALGTLTPEEDRLCDWQHARAGAPLCGGVFVTTPFRMAFWSQERQTSFYLSLSVLLKSSTDNIGRMNTPAPLEPS